MRRLSAVLALFCLLGAARAQVIPGAPKPAECVLDTSHPLATGLFFYMPLVTDCNVDNIARPAAVGTPRYPTDTFCVTDTSDIVLTNTVNGGRYVEYGENLVAGLVPDTAFTVIMAIKNDSSDAYFSGGLFSVGDNPNANGWGDININYRTDGLVQCTIRNGGREIPAVTPIVDDTWASIACAYDSAEGGGAAFEVWVDDTGPDAGTSYTSSTNAAVGDRYDLLQYYYNDVNSYQNFIGRILYTAGWDRKLSDAEISSFMNNPWQICASGGADLMIMRRGRGR